MAIIKTRFVPSQDKWVVENCCDERVDSLEIYKAEAVPAELFGVKALTRDGFDDIYGPTNGFIAYVNGVSFTHFPVGWDWLIRNLEATYTHSVKMS